MADDPDELTGESANAFFNLDGSPGLSGCGPLLGRRVKFDHARRCRRNSHRADQVINASAPMSHEHNLATR
jgi:hypothetical protein